MKWYPWLRPHFEQLITNYQNRQGHHALLVKALANMGDDALIHAITRFLMCNQPEEGKKSCGKCRSCNLMRAGTHPDNYILELEKGKNSLGINDIRDLSEKLYKHAHLGDTKVVLFNDTTLLTEAASNALLKVLEEPPEKTWFFFSCREPKRLPATLRSRCRLYHLTIPQEKLALNWLQRKVTTVSQDTALTALRLCSGAPIAALELLQENLWTWRTKLCLALDNTLKSGDWLSLIIVLKCEHTIICLQWLITLLLDALKLQHGATIIANIDNWSLVKKLARILSSTTLYAIIHSLCQCREQLLTITGLNYELILTEQLLIIEYYLQPDAILPTYHI